MLGTLRIVDDVASEFAEHVIEAFHRRPGDRFSIALSGGDTARKCYERLASEGREQIDWWKVDVYWGDERCVAADDRDSNSRLGRESLLEQVGAANATYPMRCEDGADPYQDLVAELDYFDLVHLGLGPDGHTASLFPGSPALVAPEGCFVMINEDPSGTNRHKRMTLTYAGIAKARLVLVTVQGALKRDALRRVVSGDVSAPATNVDDENVIWLVDPAAAGGLESD